MTVSWASRSSGLPGRAKATVTEETLEATVGVGYGAHHPEVVDVPEHLRAGLRAGES